MPTISRTYTLHYVPGEGRREQGENRDKRELAVKEFAHLNTTPWLKKDLTPSGSKDWPSPACVVSLTVLTLLILAISSEV
jgi:hypothetical protein